MSYSIKIYATIIILIDKWITPMKIVDHVNISYYATHHTYENS